MSGEIAALLVAVGLGLSGVTLALALDGPALVAGWSAEAVDPHVGRETDRRGAGARVRGRVPGPRRAPYAGDEAPPEALSTASPISAGARRSPLRRRRRAARGPARRSSRPPDRLFGVAAVAFVYAASLAIVDLIQGDEAERSQTAQVALSAFWGSVGLGAIVVGLAATCGSFASAGSRFSGRGREGVRVRPRQSSTSSTASCRSSRWGWFCSLGAYAYQRVRSAGGQR